MGDARKIGLIPRRVMEPTCEDEKYIWNSFKEKFYADPEYIVRVPGRVNLIGEHIDYCGYPVFPMALEKHIFVAVRSFDPSQNNGHTNGSIHVNGSTHTNGHNNGPANGHANGHNEPHLTNRNGFAHEPQLHLSNTDEKYVDFKAPLGQLREMIQCHEKGSPPWYLYFACGLLGGSEWLQMPETSLNSLQVLIHGTVPPSAGLSSSSALVCAAATATLLINQSGNVGTQKEMAALCAQAERLIGTAGGGMDQAIAFMAQPGTAQLIEFFPSLEGETVTVPSDAIFLVANSLAVANKAASNAFNERVAETRMATWILAKQLGAQNPLEYTKTKALEVEFNTKAENLLKLAMETFQEESYSIPQIAEFLEVGKEKLMENPLISKVNSDGKKFHLKPRIQHVLSERMRVMAYKNTCMAALNPEAKLQTMGDLMNESHESLRTLYNCSHPLLHKLVELSQPFVYGARLTGAGFGGCIVSLVKKSQLPGYMETLRTKFYKPLYNLEDIDAHVFVSRPGQGATIHVSPKMLQ